MLHKMFVILITLGSPVPSGLASEASLEFIPVTKGVPGNADCLVSNSSCYVPTSADQNLVVKNAKVAILSDMERAISLELNESDGEALQKLTSTHVGEHLAVMSQGRVVFTGLIREQMNSRTLQITVEDQLSYDELVESLGVDQ